MTKRFVKDDLNDDFETSLTELEPLEKDAYIVRLVSLVQQQPSLLYRAYQLPMILKLIF